MKAGEARDQITAPSPQWQPLSALVSHLMHPRCPLALVRSLGYSWRFLEGINSDQQQLESFARTTCVLGSVVQAWTRAAPTCQFQAPHVLSTTCGWNMRSRRTGWRKLCQHEVHCRHCILAAGTAHLVTGVVLWHGGLTRDNLQLTHVGKAEKTSNPRRQLPALQAGSTQCY